VGARAGLDAVENRNGNMLCIWIYVTLLGVGFGWAPNNTIVYAPFHMPDTGIPLTASTPTSSQPLDK